MTMTIIETDLTDDDRFSAILVMDNAPAGEITMSFGVRDAAGHFSVGTSEALTVSITGTSAPGAATRREDIRGGLIHG